MQYLNYASALNLAEALISLDITMKNTALIPNESKLMEYQMAQESAQHHDNLVWTVSTLTWGVSSVLLGFVLNNVEENTLNYVILLFCLIGIFLIICSWMFARQFRNIRNQKYRRCKVLERELGFLQHTKTEHPVGSQSFWYSGVMVLFLVTWGAVSLQVVSELVTEFLK
jgi:hypothetical protein